MTKILLFINIANGDEKKGDAVDTCSVNSDSDKVSDVEMFSGRPHCSVRMELSV